MIRRLKVDREIRIGLGWSIMVQIALKDAQLQLPDLIAAAVRGDEVIIIQEDQHGVRLVPIEPIRPRPRFGSARGKVLFMADDFDAPLEEFLEYGG